nr:RNA-directed DNA polymerase, eukaryota, reverse transcriptase zinc-binding domain protein [Tanacetum cinerariifolium]
MALDWGPKIEKFVPLPTPQVRLHGAALDASSRPLAKLTELVASEVGVGVSVFDEVYIEGQIIPEPVDWDTRWFYYISEKVAEFVVEKLSSSLVRQAAASAALAEAALSELPGPSSVSNATVVDASQMESSGVSSASIVNVEAASPFDDSSLNDPQVLAMSRNQAMLCKWWWRFHKENSALWHKAIRSIHGLDGGRNDFSSIKFKSGPWLRIAKLKEDLCKVGIDMPLIFKKRLKMDVTLGFGLIISLEALLLRPIRSGPYSDELTALCNLVAQLPLSDDFDLWECTVDDTRIFTIKGMRFHIINPTSPLPTTSSPTRWNNLIPLKVNVFTWRTANQRLPTRSNIDFRGIDVHTVICPLCEEVTESEEHIFFLCGIAKEIWKGLVDWWNTLLQKRLFRPPF